MKTSIIISLLAFTILMSQCTSTETKEKLKKVGDETGQTVGKLISGVTEGVEKAFEPKIDLPQNLKDKGIEFGKTTIANDSIGEDNLLVVYVIFNKDFKGDLTAKAFDSKNLEMGRVKISIEGKKEEAKFIDFHFDRRTNIDSDSKITIE